MSRFRFFFVIFYLTAVLIFTVYLRGVNNRIFYEIRQCEAVQSRLRQELGTKQLRLEKLINPAAVSLRFDESNAAD
jgi:hypothetical protein